MMAMEPMRVDFQVFPEAAVTGLAHSTTLAISLTGGVIHHMIQILPGTALLTKVLTMCTGPIIISKTGIPFVASGIKICKCL